MYENLKIWQSFFLSQNSSRLSQNRFLIIRRATIGNSLLHDVEDRRKIVLRIMYALSHDIYTRLNRQRFFLNFSINYSYR